LRSIYSNSYVRAMSFCVSGLLVDYSPNCPRFSSPASARSSADATSSSADRRGADEGHPCARWARALRAKSAPGGGRDRFVLSVGDNEEVSDDACSCRRYFFSPVDACSCRRRWFLLRPDRTSIGLVFTNRVLASSSSSCSACRWWRAAQMAAAAPA
jgi:hypothetical protein